MEELMAYRADLLSALEEVIIDLTRIVDKLPPSAWHQPIKHDPRSPHYVLFHLRELESQVFALQLGRIQDEKEPVLPIFDDEAWMDSHYHPEEPVSAIMQEISQLRKHELNWLRNLPSADWSRSARHAWWGEHTLQWWVELQLEYSFQHLKRLASVNST